MTPAAGIYLHWPFCERKCPYCDFFTFGREHPWHALEGDYAEALCAEIRSAPERMGWTQPPAADTIYFGGGTPSLMGAGVMERLLGVLSETFALAEGTEVTLEVNPTTAEAVALGDYLALGVNRLSVGAQSFNDRLLAELGRVHDAATTRRAIEKMRRLGAANISLDLIFATPGQRFEDFEADLEELIAHEPEHVSVYGLTIHEQTPYARWQREGRLALPEEDEAAGMYERLRDRLGEAGFEHYEISNWARPGRRSRHNSKYWSACDVAAFGVSAHGVWGGVRTENPRDLKGYLALDRRELAVAVEPPAGERSRLGEIMMLALRRVPGASWEELGAWAGRDPRAVYGPELQQLQADGLLAVDEQGVRLTQRGVLLADTVMAEFF